MCSSDLLSRIGTTRRVASIAFLIFVSGFIVRAQQWITHVSPTHSEYSNANIWIPYQMYIYFPTFTRWDGLLIGSSIAAIQTLRTDWWNTIIRQGDHLLVAGFA